MCLRDLKAQYRLVGPHVRRQVKWTAVVWAAFAGTTVAFADDPANPLKSAANLLTVPNIMALVALVYGAGILREQFAETRDRITKLEDAFREAMDDTIPNTYVRKDVYRARVD